MIRKTFVIKLKPGCAAEYKRRHDNLWPEIDQLIRNQGIRNYTIWNYEDTLFAYYEVEQEEPPLTEEEAIADARWQAYMSDIIEIVKDPATNDRKKLELMFLHE